jgi:hypothetical protein
VADGEEGAVREKRRRGVRRSEAQWIEILRRFESSGVGSKDFCQRQGLALSSLQRWRRRLGRVPSDKFVELVPSLATAGSSAPWSLEVSLPGGACLRFQG